MYMYIVKMLRFNFILDLNSALGSEVSCKCTFNWLFKLQGEMKHSYAYKKLTCINRFNLLTCDEWFIKL